MWRTVRRNLGVINQHSTVINNIADVANGGYVFEKQGDKIIQVRYFNRCYNIAVKISVYFCRFVLIKMF